MRETRDGSLLLELAKGSKSASAAKSIAAAISAKLGDSVGKVSQLGVQTEVEILDLDAVSTAGEVLEALRSAIPDQDDSAAQAARESICDVRIWPTRSGQQIATAKMSRHAASLITRMAVGWTMCRVRARTLPPERCYRCQGFGHNSRSCTETDRTGACWKCGLTDHLMKDCKASEDCCLPCELAGLSKTSHKPGSGACAARKRAAGAKSNTNEQLMFQTAVETEADILVVSEPFTKCGRDDKWCFSTDRKAAVASTQGSSLFRNSVQLLLEARHLDYAIRANDSAKLVVAGDFNAWNTEWGSRTNNPRGRLLSDLAASLGLLLANIGTVPTFVRGTATSVIDVTWHKGLILSDWRVLESDSLSDHKYVCFGSHVEQQPPQRHEPATVHRAWSVKRRDPLKFASYVEAHPLNLSCGDTVERAMASAQSLDAYLIEACDASMPKKSLGPRGRLPVHWWSVEISDLRKKVLGLRSIYQDSLRRVGLQGSEAARSNFSLARKDLRLSIRLAKDKSWRDLCDQVETDSWGKPYRIIMKKNAKSHTRDAAKGKEDTIADHLFPMAPPDELGSSSRPRS
ncbi:uncharacterized protein LOC132924736 [Rhopalosiphum padi]|uniref:uncharacterized protein LOC132924736 n=1 Tax=Rhopalosiphum padi TaxID=40932 RepID=UPI00298D84C4|nr:uncharacterized protein LOC132924736 [Rhopalosiphum padi]